MVINTISQRPNGSRAVPQISALAARTQCAVRKRNSVVCRTQALPCSAETDQAKWQLLVPRSVTPALPIATRLVIAAIVVFLLLFVGIPAAGFILR